MRAQRETVAGIEEGVVSAHAGSIVVIEGVCTVASADREGIEGTVRTVRGISGINQIVFRCHVLRIVEVADRRCQRNTPRSCRAGRRRKCCGEYR